MQKTSNYNLNQWDSTDPIRREDFNADNAAVDNALAAFAVSMGSTGNCRIATGSYVGDGTYDEENPNRLEFEFKPLLVVIGRGLTKPSNNPETLSTSILMRPAECGSSVTEKPLKVTWGDTWVEWYCDMTQSAGAQNNEEGRTYYWTVYGVAE